MSRTLVTFSASEILDGLSNGDFTSKDVLVALNNQRMVVNDDVNAFEFVAPENHDGRLGPLSGLPITVKDQIAVANMPLNNGSDRLNRQHPKRTASVIDRFVKAGAEVYGKTTLPPYAMDFQTFNKRNGHTRNPWNLELTAGGSSGGGAAAVATGMSFLDIGADLSGSLRLPAAFCGVFSLMPTDGTIETDGLLPRDAALEHFARPGPIARTVDDLQLAWATMLGGESPEAKRQGARIAVWDDESGDLPVSENVALAFKVVCEALAVEGIEITRRSLESLFDDDVYACFGEIMGYETGGLLPAPVRMLERMTGKSAARRSPRFLTHVHNGYRRDPKRYQKALDRREHLQALFDSSWSELDALLIPVCGVQPFAHQTPRRERGGLRDYTSVFEIGNVEVGYLDALTSFTVPVSLMGNPVVTIPLGLDADGLPVGAQLVGKRGGEWELLRIASQLSQSLPTLRNPYLPGREAPPNSHANFIEGNVSEGTQDDTVR